MLFTIKVGYLANKAANLVVWGCFHDDQVLVREEGKNVLGVAVDAGLEDSFERGDDIFLILSLEKIEDGIE